MNGIKIKEQCIEVTWNTSPQPRQVSSTNAFIKVEDEAVVDGVNWYTILVTKEVVAWLQTQDKRQWYEHKSSSWGEGYRVVNMFDVHEELYLIMKLRF